MSDVAANLAEIRSRVADAEKRAGRAPGEVQLMVVSKTWPAERVMESVDAGQTLFGENKVQELCAKVPEMPKGLSWHFIGHLQRNKVRKVLPYVEAVHSIDSARLAGYCDRIAGELKRKPMVYLEVNLGDEESKHGFAEEGLIEELEQLQALENLKIEGLMCIPPSGGGEDQARRWFGRLRALRDELVTRSGMPLPGLSMGMSHDYVLAIEEGATIVRVGSAVFGARR